MRSTGAVPGTHTGTQTGALLVTDDTRAQPASYAARNSVSHLSHCDWNSSSVICKSTRQRQLQAAHGPQRSSDQTDGLQNCRAPIR